MSSKGTGELKQGEIYLEKDGECVCRLEYWPKADRYVIIIESPKYRSEFLVRGSIHTLMSKFYSVISKVEAGEE